MLVLNPPRCSLVDAPSFVLRSGHEVDVHRLAVFRWGLWRCSLLSQCAKLSRRSSGVPGRTLLVVPDGNQKCAGLRDLAIIEQSRSIEETEIWERDTASLKLAVDRGAQRNARGCSAGCVADVELGGAIPKMLQGRRKELGARIDSMHTKSLQRQKEMGSRMINHYLRFWRLITMMISRCLVLVHPMGVLARGISS